jgi:hypothetical protein
VATISITVDDTLVPRLVAAMRATFPQYGPDGANLTDAQCFKRVTADYWRGVVTAHETRQAQVNADTQVSVAAAQTRNDFGGMG